MTLLHNLDIAVPCTESWDAMQGDDQVRHCKLCKKNVYNLSAMPQAEAAALLAGNVDGALCVRFYRRSDGTVMTSDCGTSPRVKVVRALRRLPRVAGAAGVAGTMAMAAAVAQAMPEPDLPQPVLMGAPPPVSMPVEKKQAPDQDKPHKAEKKGPIAKDEQRASK